MTSSASRRSMSTPDSMSAGSKVPADDDAGAFVGTSDGHGGGEAAAVARGAREEALRRRQPVIEKPAAPVKTTPTTTEEEEAISKRFGDFPLMPKFFVTAFDMLNERTAVFGNLGSLGSSTAGDAEEEETSDRERAPPTPPPPLRAWRRAGAGRHSRGGARAHGDGRARDVGRSVLLPAHQHRRRHLRGRRRDEQLPAGGVARRRGRHFPAPEARAARVPRRGPLHVGGGEGGGEARAPTTSGRQALQQRAMGRGGGEWMATLANLQMDSSRVWSQTYARLSKGSKETIVWASLSSCVSAYLARLRFHNRAPSFNVLLWCSKIFLSLSFRLLQLTIRLPLS